MFKKYWFHIAVVAVIILAFMPVMMNNDGIFVFYGDSYQQLYHYFLGAWLKLRELNVLGFDFSVGLGVNFFATIFYILTPFFWIQLLMPKEMIKYSFLFLSILKLIVLYVTTNLWLSQITSNKYSRWIGATILTFSGWVIFYLVVGFVDFFVLYPICLYFIERYLKNDKKFGLIASIAILCIANYYFAYMFIPFACLYGLYRYIILNNNVTFKMVIINAMKFLGLILLGVGISCFVLLPSYYVVSLEPRLKESYSLVEHISKYDLYSIVSSLFSPVLDRFQANAFINETNRNFLGWNGGATLFIGVLSMLLLPLIIFIKDKKEKIAILAGYVTFAVFIYFFLFYRLFQGSIETRWFYMLTIFNVYVIVRVIDALFSKQIKKRNILFTYIIWLLAIVCCSLISRHYGFYTNEIMYAVLRSCLVVMTIFGLFYVLVLNFKFKYQIPLICVLLLLESGYYLRTFIVNNEPIKLQYLLDAENTSAVDYLKSIDNSFYRIIYGTDDLVTANEPSAKNFNGTTFYSSLYNFEQADYLKRFLNTWSLPQFYGRFYTDNLVGVKYYYTKNNLQSIPYGYRYIATIEGYAIYENPYFYNLGYATNKTISIEAFEQLSYLNQDRLLVDTIVTANSDNSDTEFINDLQLIGEYSGEEIFVEIPAESDMTIFFEYNLESSLNITTMNNWQENGQYYFNQLHYASLYFPKDQYVTQIKIKQSNPDNVVRIYRDKTNAYYPQAMEKINDFYDVNYNNSHISAKINVTEKNSWVFTSIPYDKGFSVYVDGNKIDYEMVNQGFIGFELAEGEHFVEFVYCAPLFKEGIIISVMSLLAMITYLSWSKIKFKRSKTNEN